MIIQGDQKPGRLRSIADEADEADELLLETSINISPLPILRQDLENPERFSTPGLLNAIAREGTVVCSV